MFHTSILLVLLLFYCLIIAHWCTQSIQSTLSPLHITMTLERMLHDFPSPFLLHVRSQFRAQSSQCMLNGGSDVLRICPQASSCQSYSETSSNWAMFSQPP
uniref:Secreted protein n=1 Tax=Anguilla anguilla TaxID=7936 RepID=A0A0E9W5F5_ANGAN